MDFNRTIESLKTRAFLIFDENWELLSVIAVMFTILVIIGIPLVGPIIRLLRARRFKKWAFKHRLHYQMTVDPETMPQLTSTALYPSKETLPEVRDLVVHSSGDTTKSLFGLLWWTGYRHDYSVPHQVALIESPRLKLPRMTICKSSFYSKSQFRSVGPLIDVPNLKGTDPALEVRSPTKEECLNWLTTNRCKYLAAAGLDAFETTEHCFLLVNYGDYDLPQAIALLEKSEEVARSCL